jgi:DnaK suppressor protein
MARREALVRLHKSLLARRADLLKRLGVEMQDLGNTRLAVSSGDSADAAFDSGSEEIASQLAELEARELNQVQRAINRLKQGSYGQCEICSAKIPVARLNALPYSTLCIKCQRDNENHGEGDAGYNADWDRVADAEHSYVERREVDISDIEMDLSK